VYYDADEPKWDCKAAAECQCGGMVMTWNFKLDYYGSLNGDETPLSFQLMRLSER
jgi:hypothetical protein